MPRKNEIKGGSQGGGRPKVKIERTPGAKSSSLSKVKTERTPGTKSSSLSKVKTERTPGAKSLSLSEDALSALQMLVLAWDVRQTQAVERALIEAAKRLIK